MRNCFEQYEKENIKVFEEKDKARCLELMANIEEKINNNSPITCENTGNELSEIIQIYDQKRLYPFI